MTFRLLLSAFAALSLSAAPALADEAESAAETSLPTFVNPDPEHDPENVVYLDLSNHGRVAFRLMPEWAPRHVERIKTLVQQGFYDGIVFHRVVDGFMAQTGDPTGTGAGGSQLPDLEPEFNSMPHLRGTVSMARTNDPNSANSQFFIVFYPRFALDEEYTIFGRVIGGMDAVDTIAKGEPPANPTRIVQASLASEQKAPPPRVAPAAEAVTISVADLENSVSD